MKKILKPQCKICKDILLNDVDECSCGNCAIKYCDRLYVLFVDEIDTISLVYVYFDNVGRVVKIRDSNMLSIAKIIDVEEIRGVC